MGVSVLPTEEIAELGFEPGRVLRAGASDGEAAVAATAGGDPGHGEPPVGRAIGEELRGKVAPAGLGS